jgi:hypothetical protein
MTAFTTYGTVAGSGYGITLTPQSSDAKPRTPSGLIVTQSVQTREGWLGQIIIDKEIVWESDPCHTGDDAIQDANGRVVDVFKQLFQAAPEVTS